MSYQQNLPHEGPDLLDPMVDVYDKVVDGIENVIGRGNFKWVVLGLVLLLVLWWARHRRS
jgi:hypothetical protein